MRYPVVVHKDPESDYGVTVPDLPGCFSADRSIATVQEYVLVSQDAKHIDHYRRQSENLWVLTSIDGDDGVLELPTIECRLPLAEIYEKVPFDIENDTARS